MEHLTNMEYLREGIGWRGYAGTDPLVLYKKEAFDMFQLLLGSLQDEVIRLVFNTQVQIQPPPALAGLPGFGDMPGGEGEGLDEDDNSPLGAAAAAAPNPFAAMQRAANPPRRLHKVGRNDPCPCGSGKKFKQCHGK